MFRIVFLFTSSLILACTFIGPANAADAKQIMNLEIEASKQAVLGNFNAAITSYSKIIELAPTKADAYLERALLYRELGDVSRSMADAAYALGLVQAKMDRGGNSEKLYFQRATAYRLLKKFDLAKQDLQIAINKSGSTKYNDDMQAIILEEKMK